jgi:hypothetical protein
MGSLTLVLQIAGSAEPITGQLSTDDGGTWRFTGWLQLTAALEEAMHREWPSRSVVPGG